MKLHRTNKYRATIFVGHPCFFFSPLLWWSDTDWRKNATWTVGLRGRILGIEREWAPTLMNPLLPGGDFQIVPVCGRNWAIEILQVPQGASETSN